MTAPVKITSDELQVAQEMRRRFAELTHDYGRLGFAQLALDRERSDVECKFDQLSKDEERFIRELNDKYGTGTLNVETGDFTSQRE